MKYLMPCSVVFLCLILLTGCAGLSKKESDLPKNASLLEPSAIIKFSDLPIPAGFRYIGKESYSFESSGIRIGALKYQGKAEADQVVNFYREQMPMHNWLLLNIVEYGQRLMNFEKDTESCIITIEPRGNASLVTVSLGPKSQFPQKLPKEPVK